MSGRPDTMSGAVLELVEALRELRRTLAAAFGVALLEATVRVASAVARAQAGKRGWDGPPP